MKFEYIVTL